MKKNLFASLFLLFMVTGVRAQNIMIEKNIQYQYDLRENMFVRHKACQSGDSTRVDIQIRLNTGVDIHNYIFTLDFKKNYHTKQTNSTDTISVDELIPVQDQVYYFSSTFRKPDDTDLLILQVKDITNSRKYFYDIPIITEELQINAGLILMQPDTVLPEFEYYIKKNKPFTITDITGNAKEVYVYYYSMEFEEAYPPMVAENKPVSKTISVDTLTKRPVGNTISFSNPGLYFIQKDTSTSQGIGIRVQNEHYPFCRTFEDLIEPLKYISTKEETDKIRTSEDRKKAFELFWLNLTDNKEKAGVSIKNYYERVESANLLFTSYKEGWKTDMGIIYIVYGIPDEVYRSEETEEWIYHQNKTIPTIRFSFYRMKNIFTDNHYNLLRKTEFDKHWFKSVEAWRKGKIN